MPLANPSHAYLNKLSMFRSNLDTPTKRRPGRYWELVSKHGELDALVKVDLTPEYYFNVKVQLSNTQQSKDMVISVRQRVRTFKAKLSNIFKIPAENMRLWYFDKVTH